MNSSDFEFDDLQGLLRFGHAKLPINLFYVAEYCRCNCRQTMVGTARSVTQCNQTHHRTQHYRLPSLLKVACLGTNGNPLSKTFPMNFITGMSAMKAAPAGLEM